MGVAGSRSCGLSVSGPEEDEGFRDAIPGPPALLEGFMPAKKANLTVPRLFATHGGANDVGLHLKPAFAPTVHVYKAIVPYDVSSVVLTPVDYDLTVHIQIQTKESQRVVGEYYDIFQPQPEEEPEEEEEKSKKKKKKRDRRLNGADGARVDSSDSSSDSSSSDDEEEEEKHVPTWDESPWGDYDPSLPTVTPGGPSMNETPGGPGGDYVTPGGPEPEVELPKKEVPKVWLSYRIDNLAVGKNPIIFNITHPDADPVQYTIVVEREEWHRDGWKDENKGGAASKKSKKKRASDRDRFRWYLRGAEDGNPVAQYYLALMYAGDDIAVIEWEKLDKRLEHQEHLIRQRARREQARRERAEKERQEQRMTNAAANGDNGYNSSSDDENRKDDDNKDENDLSDGGEWGIEWTADDWMQSSEMQSTMAQIQNTEKIREYKAQCKRLHYKWLLASARQKYTEAMYRLANVYYMNNVPKEILNEEELEDAARKKMEENRLRSEEDYEERSKLIKTSNDRMVDPSFHKQRAAQLLEETADVGDIRAAYQLAQMYVNGEGVPMDFKQAIYWFVERAGVPEVIARQAIRKKFSSLKSKYKKIFNRHDTKKRGYVDRKQFQGLYRDMWMATGMSKAKAEKTVSSVYAGKTKSDVIFQAYDKDGDHKITFEELWSHAHTHTSLLARTEKQLVSSYRFFDRIAKRTASTLHLSTEDASESDLNNTFNRMRSTLSLEPDAEDEEEDTEEDASSRKKPMFKGASVLALGKSMRASVFDGYDDE